MIEARAKLSGAEALIEHLQLVIAKMKRELFGPRSERSQRLLDQLELQLEELAAAAGEDAAARATAGGLAVVMDLCIGATHSLLRIPKKA